MVVEYKQRVKLPKLHVNQQKVYDDILNNGTRHTVLRAGRRFGKSRLALVVALDWAINHGKRVWWVSPSYKVSDSQWRLTKQIVRGLWSNKNEIGRYLEFHYRRDDGTMSLGELAFRSGDRPDNLRGEGIDLLIIDEAAFVDETIWTKVLSPALTDRKGSVIFISTPNGLNWFYNIYVTADSEEGKADSWRAWHFTSYDNPTIDPKEIDAAKRRMPLDIFEEEHLAAFKEDGGRVFRKVVQLSTAKPESGRIINHVYGMGIDLGRKHDATVISIIDLTTGKQVAIDRFTQIDWTVQLQRVMAAINRWQPAKVYIEENFDSMFVQELINRGAKNIEIFRMTGVSKVPLIEGLISVMENEVIRLLDDSTFEGRQQINELRAFQVQKTRGGEQWTYGAPDGVHDDTVIALALAVKAIVSRPSQLEIVDNPFYGLPEIGFTIVNAPRSSSLDAYRQESRRKLKELVDTENAFYSTIRRS